MQKYIVITVTALIVLLFVLTSIFHNQLLDCMEQLEQAENNTKALLMAKDSLSNNGRILQLSIDQLECYNDSITKVLNKTIDKLNVEKNKVTQLQYSSMTNTRTDTLVFRDTLFIKDINIDTTTTDNKWYSINIKLRYPNTLNVTPTFNNEIVTIFNYKKETINPPKKCFILRWFQKKHIITETRIINNNPYSTVDTTRIIEIVNM